MYVSPGFFDTMAIARLAGRDFASTDTARSRKVAIVNEAFVRRYIGDEPPLGLPIRTVAEPGFPETLYEIVGIARDTKYADLRDDMPPAVYVPYAQRPSIQPSVGITIRTETLTNDVIGDMRRRLGEQYPNLMMRFSVFEQQVNDRLARERTMAWLAAFFGVLATGLAMLGAYGLISYIAARRRHELGLRLALGASRRDLVLSMLGPMNLMLVIGLGIGLVGAIIVSQTADRLLFAVSARDPRIFALAISLLASVVAIATLVPAWRGSRLDPMTILRHD